MEKLKSYIKNIFKSFKKRRFRRKLKYLDDTELINKWSIYLFYTFFNQDDEVTHEYFELIQEEIYLLDDLKPYIDIVEGYGLQEILLPWFVLREFLFYSIDKSGDDDTGIIRRVENGNLRGYINFSVLPLMSTKMREKITQEDIDYVVELMESYA